LSARVKIVTDSTAYLSPETVARYDIRVVPLKVIFGNEAFAEGLDITNEEFYQRLARSKALPTTSQPSVSDFIQVYAELTQPGYDIFSIHISGKLSGTINSALAARAAFPQARIEVVDWLSMGMGLLVLAAARAAEEGQGLAEIKAMIKRLTANMNIFGTLGTLKYLQKGGRIGTAATLVGTLLKIKPVLALDNGEVRVLAKPRNRGKAIQCMLKFMVQRVEERARIHGAIVHTRAPEEALVLEKKVRARFDCDELYFIELGPVFATHTGPGTLGMAFYSDGLPERDSEGNYSKWI
jgi:DegV family protein with EDD domain